jgi:para-nitrobenzyl esterase
VLACLRAKPVGTVLDAMLGMPPEGIQSPWVPTFATPVLPVNPTEAIAAGAFHRVPVIAGTNLDEGTVFVAFLEASGTPVTAETYPVVLSQLFGTNAPRVQAQYPGTAYGGDYRLALSAVYTDYLFACPTWTLNRALSKATRVFAYEFADRTAPNLYSFTPEFPLGAYHGAELAYLFPTGSLLNPAQRRLSDRMLSYWTRFAAAGNPNGNRPPYWRSFRPAHPTVLTLDLAIVNNENGFDTQHHCDFWNTVRA